MAGSQRTSTPWTPRLVPIRFVAEAGVDGGGLYLSGCDLNSYSGGALRGVVGNRAGRRGGGEAGRDELYAAKTRKNGQGID